MNSVLGFSQTHPVRCASTPPKRGFSQMLSKWGIVNSPPWRGTSAGGGVGQLETFRKLESKPRSTICLSCFQLSEYGRERFRPCQIIQKTVGPGDVPASKTRRSHWPERHPGLLLENLSA